MYDDVNALISKLNAGIEVVAQQYAEWVWLGESSGCFLLNKIQRNIHYVTRSKVIQTNISEN
jgi:hypothetical protein